MNSKVESNETKQIIEDIYSYVKSIKLEIDWDFEFMREKAPVLSFKQVSTGANKIQQYIAGGYDAEIPFIVYHKNYVDDTRKTLNITKPLNDLISIFDKETKQGFPKLKINDESINPVSLEVVSTPEDVTGIENNVAVYMATYKLVYHKKGRFE